MKKTLMILSILSLTGLNAQTKQAAEATQMATGTALTAQSAYAIQYQPVQAQTISGYYQQNFENTAFPPTGWRMENVSGPSYTWARSTAQAHNSSASAFMRYDVSGGEDWLITPRYLVTATTDSLVFWMRLAYSGYAPDSLCIKVSTTDSLVGSFATTLLKLSEGNNYPGNNTTWYRYAVSLSAYNGQQIYLAFKHYNFDGDGLYVDDVTIGTRPAAEVATTAILSPAASVGAGSYTPSASFYNNGSATQTFSVTAEITPGGYTSTSTVTSLASSATANASFASWNATPGVYTLKVYTQLAGDADHQDDTLTRTITVYSPFVNYGWSTMPVLPAGRWATGPVFANPCLSSADTGFVYLISGSDASFTNSALNTRYNTVTGAYQNMAAIPQSRTQIAPVQVNGKIYVIGGYSGSFSPVTTNSIYDIATDTWTTGAAIPTAVGDYAIGVYRDSLIYVIGGYNGTGDVNLVQIYDTYLDTWTAGTPKTGPAVAGGRMGITGDKIVFVGGYSQTLAATQSAAVLGTISAGSPATITWSTLPNYPGGTSGRLGGGVAFEPNGLVYFTAGDPNGQGTTVINTTYAYNTNLNQWEVGPNIPTGVSNINSLAGAVRNDSLYLVAMGGYDGTSVVSSNYWLNIGPASPLPTAQNDTSMCAGSTIQLNAYNGETYSWSPAASLSDSSIANPVSSATITTTYSVTMTKATHGCPVTKMITLTVNPKPAVTAGVSATAVCAGDSVLFNGGGAQLYSWTGGVTDGSYFTPAATDSYTVTGVDVNGCSNTDTVMVIVNPNPTVTAGVSTTAICSGDSVLFNGGGAQFYSWTGGVTDGSYFTPAATDSYTVTGIDMNGCSDTGTVTVTVNPNPAVTAGVSAAAICAGDSVLFNGSGAVFYSWTGGVTDGSYFTPAATDTYTVTGTDGNGCSGTDAVVVTVHPNPIVTVSLALDTLCDDGGIFTLNGETPAGGAWSGNGVSGNTFDPMAGAGMMNVITYQYTDTNGCSGSAMDSLWVNTCSGITETTATNNLLVYPNPNDGLFTITLTAAAAGPAKVEITNSLGQAVQAFTMTGTAQQVDLRSLQEGVYFVRVVKGDVITVQRIVKK